MSENFDIVILGAGYAGLMCLARLGRRARRKGLRVALVSDASVFVERPRIHEFLARTPEAPNRPLDIAAFARDVGATFVQARVETIDSLSAHVELSGGRTLAYKRLVIALGSRVATKPVDGVAEHAFVAELNGARSFPALRARIAGLGPFERDFIVAGAGATGIEIAGELAAIEGARVRLVTQGQFADFATPSVRRALRRALDQHNVSIVEDAPIAHVAEKRLQTTKGDMSFDFCIWCGGFEGQEPVLATGLGTNPQGRLLVDRWLRTEDPQVYAVGDACLPTASIGAPPRMSVLFALVSGAHAADVLWAEMRRRPARALNFATYGQAIQVGDVAVGYGSYPNDRQIGPIYTGRTAYHLRTFFVSVLFGLLKWEKRFPGFPFWTPRPGVVGEKRRSALSQLRAA